MLGFQASPHEENFYPPSPANHFIVVNLPQTASMPERPGDLASKNAKEIIDEKTVEHDSSCGNSRT